MASDMEKASRRIAEAGGLRAVLVAGNGPNFTMGGDVNFLASTPVEQLPDRLRRMIDGYHRAIVRLMSIDTPFGCRSARCNRRRGLGLLYGADTIRSIPTWLFIP